jgi:hypothetical protein
LISYTPNLDTLIATSMLTTTSGAQPSVLFERLIDRPEKVKDIINRIEVQHGNILEHNRIIWELDAKNDEVLNILINSKFFNLTKIKYSNWLISASLRTIVEYSQKYSDQFIELIIDSIQEVSPQIHELMRKGTK